MNLQGRTVLARAAVLMALSFMVLPSVMRGQRDQSATYRIPLERVEAWHLQALPGIGPVTAQKLLRQIEQGQELSWPKRSRDVAAQLIQGVSK